MSKVTELTKEFQRVMYSTTYSFEIQKHNKEAYKKFSQGKQAKSEVNQ